MINSENKSQGDLRDLLNVIFKHKTKIITIFLSVVTAVTVGTFLTSPTYEASSKILVKFGRENIFMPTNPLAEAGNSGFFDSSKEERINSEVEILIGRNLIKTVITELGVNTVYPAPDKKTFIPRAEASSLERIEKATLAYEKRLSAAAVKKSNIIKIKFLHKDPIIAAQVVNKHVDAFLEHHLAVYKESAKFGFFDDQVKRQEKMLIDSGNKLETFRKQNRITSLATQKDLLLAQISNLEESLAATRSEISENEGKLHSFKGDHPSTALTVTKMGAETELNPQAIAGIRIRLSDLKLKEQELSGKYTDQSVKRASIRKEIEKAQKLLYKEEKVYHDKAVNSISHTLNALKSKAKKQEQQLAVYQQKLISVNSTERELRALERQVETNEKNYERYVKHMEEARISNAMDSQKIANISVVEPALPPIKPVKPKKSLNIMLSIFMGIFAGFGAAFCSEYFSHTFTKNEDINKHLDLPVFASIAEPEPHTPMDFKLSHQVSEEYHRLKHHLLSSAADKKIKTILFASPEHGEGNSTVLSNFAITLASRGDKVLLVDTNLRDPSLHDLFSLDKKDGLTELLLEDKSLDDVIKQPRLNNLSIITGGISHSESSNLLESQSLDSFIEQIKPFFAWILFDSPSILSCNDASILADKMDEVVMVVQAENINWEAAQIARERIENNKIKVLGAVLNRKKMYIPGWIYKAL